MPGLRHRDGSLKLQIYPSGRPIHFDYDQAGRPTLAEVNNSTPDYLSVSSYAPHGGILTATLGNGLHQTITYDENQLWVTGIKLGPSAGSDADLGLSYNHTVGGNVTSHGITRPNFWAGWTVSPPASGSWTYSPYDSLNRVRQVTETGSWT